MLRLIKAFFSRITKDFQHRELFPLKILFFVHASTLLVLYPYLTIHMRELGINVEETAIMSAVTPVVTIIMPPLAGMIADKIGNFRLLLAVSSMLGGAAALLLLLVPVGRVTVTFPPRADLALGCPGAGAQDARIQAAAIQYACDPVHPYAFDLDMRLETCGIACDWISENETFPFSDAESYLVQVRNPKEEVTHAFRYSLQPKDLPQDSSVLDQNSKRIIHNSDRYRTKIRRLSNRSMFFPTDGMFGLSCQKQDNSTRNVCGFGTNSTLIEAEDSKTHQKFFASRIKPLTDILSDEVMMLSMKSDNQFIQLFDLVALSETEDDRSNSNDTIERSQADGYSDTFCSDFFSKLEISVELVFRKRAEGNESQMTLAMKECSSRCLASTPREALCSNVKEEVELDPSITFWTYMAVRVFIGIIGGTGYAMFEGAVIAILREHEADYGLQRIYGSIGGMISSPLSGMLIDYASKDKGYTDFRPAFYLYAILKFLSALLMMCINLEFKSPASNLVKDVVTVLKNVEIVALFVVCFVLGTIWGYIESFLFWLLQDLGASRSLMGVTITVGGIAGIPLLVLSGPIIHRIGHANVLFIGFLFYAIRLIGYSLIYDPWMCLIFEALEGVTTSLAFTAAVTYAARLSTTTTDTSVQGLLGGLYYGVGKGAGSLVGGYLMKAFGTRPTYQIFAGAAVLTGCIYYFFNKLYLLKRPQVEGNDICKKPPKILQNARNENNKKNSEKLRLNEKRPSLYTEGANKNGLSNIYTIGDENDEKTIFSRDSSRAQLTQGSSEAEMRGLDNPSYLDTEAPSAVRERHHHNVDSDRADLSQNDVTEMNFKNSEK